MSRWTRRRARCASKARSLKEGDWISLDGTTGRVIKGKLNTGAGSPDDPELQKFMSWAEPFRRMGVRANADIPRDALQARAFGAEGIGLCRTEHMFFAEDRLPHMRAMIMADNEKDRRAALTKLLPMQRDDFVGLFRAMDGLPVTIRTLDPPLHEFLPKREELMVEIAKLEATKPKSPKLKELRTAAERVEAVARSSIPCSACAAAVWASPIPRSPRCRRAPSSRPPSRSRKKA